jgi:SAM-dependent methyltransferase
MMQPPTFDPTWEKEIYAQGRQISRYPYDCVVSFVFRNFPRQKPRSEVRILEIGCGTGNNLWFAAREGFSVAGVDGSATAIEYARKRFADEGLAGDLRVADFTRLPFETGLFDLAIDRGALTCCGLSAAREAAGEVGRVLAPGGKFFLNPYSDRHSSSLGCQRGPDGLSIEISEGTLVHCGQLCFYGRRDIENLLDGKWEIDSIEHLELLNQTMAAFTCHAEWRVVASKRVHGDG